MVIDKKLWIIKAIIDFIGAFTYMFFYMTEGFWGWLVCGICWIIAGAFDAYMINNS